MNSTRTSGEQDSAIDVDLVVGDLHVGLELRLRKHSMRLSDFQVLHDIGVCAVLISRQDLLKKDWTLNLSRDAGRPRYVSLNLDAFSTAP